MRDYILKNWESTKDSWYDEYYSRLPSLHTITDEDFHVVDAFFFDPYHYDVNLIFNI